MNILFIGAHPDDADVWSGGTLRKCFLRGDRVFIAVLTGGAVGSNQYTPEALAPLREKEQLNAAKFYGADVRFFGFDDNELMYGVDTHRSVVEAIRWANPDVLLTHPPTDLAGDHGMTGYLVQKALISLPFKNLPTAHPPIGKRISVFHCDTYAGLNFNPDVFVDITDVFDVKRQAMLCHESQLAYGWMDMLETLSGFRGFQYGVRYAEAYKGFQFYGHMPDPRLLP